jgi:threonylcarbamoyladenosine tRNA methylthiotransferase MtaB
MGFSQNAEEPTMKTAMVTLGCRLNQYETQLLKEMAEDGCLQLTDFNKDPDLIIVNACSVTMNAAQQTRNAVRRARRACPRAIIIVTGCFSPDLCATLKEADRFVSNDDKQLFFAQLFSSQRRSISKFNKHTRAHVKIQTGCNRFCTYCIVPYLRSRERSRSPREIRGEITSLVQHGFSEITLTGIHIGRYRYGQTNLVDLLRDIENIGGLHRIRLSSLNPEEISERFIVTIASSQKICRHIHISLQSADQVVLRAMGRTYQIADIARRLAMVNAHLPDCGIGADIITGFPYETPQRFEHTYSFIEKLSFTYLHVFRYSPRKGTLAALLPHRVPEREKKRRSALLRELGLQKSIAFRNRYLNKTINVLIESRRDARTNLMVGFSDNYIRVLVPHRAKAAATFRDVRIERINEYETFGTICDNEKR